MTLGLLVALFANLIALPSTDTALSFELELLLNGQPIHWDSGERARRNGNLFRVEDPEVPLEVFFEGGVLTLDLADYGTFSRPHVLGVRYQRLSDPSSFGATVYHDPDNPTQVIRFEGPRVRGGDLELTGVPTQNPFTRSQEGVEASGTVEVRAEDAHGNAGSTITLDLDSELFAELERFNLRVRLTPQPQP
jgi:hypothetical protein